MVQPWLQGENPWRRGNCSPGARLIFVDSETALNGSESCARHLSDARSDREIATEDPSVKHRPVVRRVAAAGWP